MGGDTKSIISIGVCSERNPNKITLDDYKRTGLIRSIAIMLHDNAVKKGIKILPEQEGCYDRLLETAANYVSEQGYNIIKVDRRSDPDHLFGIFTFQVEPSDESPKKFYTRSYLKKHKTRGKYEFSTLKYFGEAVYNVHYYSA